jgi:hypothetical protein
MNLKQAIQILEYHQKWRLGIEENMIHETKTLTQAIDIILKNFKDKEE